MVTTTKLEIRSKEITTREVATTTEETITVYSKKTEDYDEEEMCWLTL